ncbi:HTH CENPB-type domain-containing protein [Trichonephila clavipes]|nr:HTH CENPB-type domain-containing protein [Trichonephila clavipes]
MRLPITRSLTGDLFKNWIKLDAIVGKQKKKSYSFVDNCPAHPKDIPTTNIKIVFLPPTATSKLQPLDQGIIKVVKQKRYSNFQTSQIPPTISYQNPETEEILQNFPDYAAVDDVTSSTRTLGDIADLSSLTTSDPVK